MTDAGDDAEVALAEHGAAFAEQLLAALPDWSARVVGRFDPALETRGRRAGAAAAAELGPVLRELLTADVDRQWANPLTVLRGAVPWPTAVLREAGVPPVRRDPVDEANEPDDVYGLSPMRFADLDESLHEPGIVWGALKARAHLRRHAS